MRNKFANKVKTIELIGEPQPKQQEFLLAEQRYVAYGGARGGGKSWALRRKCVLLAVHFGGIRVLIIRKTLQDLRENHILPLLTEIGDSIYFNNDERAMYFPNRSRIKFGYLDGESDLQQYQGQEYDIICMDEATQFTEFEFRTFEACLRGGNSLHPKRFYLTCNPGGIGHAWIKRLFIDKEFKHDRIDERGRLIKGENPEDYRFTPATVGDNRYNGPGYEQMLDNLPDKLREAWKYGNWDVFTGQYFAEWDKSIHVIKPFDVPSDWRRYFVVDYGLDMLAGYWIAVDFGGNAYVYREIYQSGLPISEAARQINQLELSNENISVRLAPEDMWGRSRESGKTETEIFADNGIYFIKASRSRIAGWMAVHEWLKQYIGKDGERTARLKIFENCVNLIRTLPLLQYDEKNTNDAAKEPHELTHAPDALRYFAISRPMGNEAIEEMPQFAFDEEREQYLDAQDPYRGLVGTISPDFFLEGWD